MDRFEGAKDVVLVLGPPVGDLPDATIASASSTENSVPDEVREVRLEERQRRLFLAGPRRQGMPRSSGVKDPSGNWIGLAQGWASRLSAASRSVAGDFRGGGRSSRTMRKPETTAPAECLRPTGRASRPSYQRLGASCWRRCRPGRPRPHRPGHQRPPATRDQRCTAQMRTNGRPGRGNDGAAPQLGHRARTTWPL